LGKIAQGISLRAPVGRLYSTFLSNLSKNFSFGGPYPYRCTDGGKIWQVPSSVPKFTPIGATCRPCAAKNLKIDLWVT